MKCTVVREHVLDAVMQAEKLTVKNHSLPLLACILLEVKDSVLFLVATNLEVGLRFSIPVQGSEDGTTAVLGGVLSHVISSFSSGTEIQIELVEGVLVVSGTEGTSRLATHPVDDYPVLPEVVDGVSCTIPAKALLDAIQAVSYCASTSTIKPELSSVYVSVEGGVLIAAATDSFRLAEKRIPLKRALDMDSILIPGKSTASLLRVLEKEDGDITLQTNDHQLSVQLGNVFVTLRLTAGTFPDYTQIIPKEFVTEATLLVFDLERALRKATVFSDQFNQTTCTISPKKKKFTVYTKNDSVGETNDSLNAAVSGEDLEINFNQRYLLDGLHSIVNDSITLQFAGRSQPALMRPQGNEGFVYLVMPMNR